MRYTHGYRHPSQKDLSQDVVSGCVGSCDCWHPTEGCQCLQTSSLLELWSVHVSVPGILACLSLPRRAVFWWCFLPKPLNFYDPARDIIETGTCRHNFSPRNVFAALHVERLGTPATQQPRPARMASRFGICRLPCKSTLEVWVVGWQYANVGGNLHSL